MIKFYDTCSLLLRASNLFDEKENFAISSITLQELENIKTSANKDENVKFSARQLLHDLDQHYGEYLIINYTTIYGDEITKKNFELTNDAKILSCYLHCARMLYPEEEVIFITNDLALKALARCYTNNVQSLEENAPDDYTGYKEITMSDDAMSDFYSNPYENPWNLNVGEYILVKNIYGEIVDRLCWNGEYYRHLDYKSFNSRWFGEIKPIKGDVYQQLACDSLMNNKITMLKGPAGTGKAQPNSTLIPTKNGYVKLGDIKVNDKIFDRFGNETTVLAIYPQGLKENYKLTFSDGRIAYCNNEHLWSCYTSKGNLKNFTVQEMLNSGLQTKNGDWKYKIPINLPIEYNAKDFKIDPYVLGAFLGDGCCKETPLTFSSNDEEIVSEISKLIQAKSYAKSSSKNYSWIFYKNDKIGTKGIKTRFQTKEFFKDYLSELAVNAQEKSIPEEYKFGSIEQRYNLLQGLLDTDGCIDNSQKGRVRFTSTSLKLIQDIQEICWSLGMSATITEDCRAEKYHTGLCYILTISCDKKDKPKLFRLSRKKNIALEYANNKIKTIHSNKLTIKSIEKMPHLEEMTCLLVDNPEHLYLTEQYIVTHNTYLALGYLMNQLERGGIDKIIIFCNTVATKNSAKLGLDG